MRCASKLIVNYFGLTTKRQRFYDMIISITHHNVMPVYLSLYLSIINFSPHWTHWLVECWNKMKQSFFLFAPTYNHSDKRFLRWTCSVHLSLHDHDPRCMIMKIQQSFSRSQLVHTKISSQKIKVKYFTAPTPFVLVVKN